MKELLIQGAAELGIRLNERQTAQLLEYAALLKEWSGKMNLTAITDDEGIAVKHFLDSKWFRLTRPLQISYSPT